MFNPRSLVLLGFVLLAVLLRLLPHPPNFAPVAALAMFGGAYFADKRVAFILPLAIMVASDLLIGFHNTLLVVYACFLAMVGIGIWVGKNKSVLNIGAGALCGSILFYLVTNFAVWAMGSGIYYPLNLQGLLMSYTAAIPFFHYTLLGDLFYTTVFFGSFELVQRYVPAVRQADSVA